jgi:hypothetical protein
MAGETACWLDNGVVVATASVGGVVGDFIVDTAAPRTILAETQAQAAGYVEPQAGGEVRLAGVRTELGSVPVTAIDARTRALPTPIAGVIGADALRSYVVDVRFAPCRLALHAFGTAPRFAGPAQVLPLGWVGQTPATVARAADGPHVLEGAFALATGSDTAVRLADDAATARGAKLDDLYPFRPLRAQLRALTLGGELFELLPSGLLKSAETEPLGEIGTPVLAGYALRFDFPAGRLLLAKQKGPPAAASGP